ncbi:MAG: FAD-dependent oxidoreductase [Armatimonadetes bacterium]|nr:FAD-dependent oxidoreductase [Armatimonadota bacterium]
MKELSCDVLVAGASLGGCAAALAAAEMDQRVILTEGCAWIGGQLTSQAVSCPDENRYIESFGATRSWYRLRNGIRDYYRRNYPLRPEVRANPTFNPGNGWVSHLCQEPRVGLAVLHEMLAPHITSGRIQLFPEHIPCSADVQGDWVRSVTFRSLRSGGEIGVHAPVVIDATETGDLLPLTGTEYVSGAESQNDTGEPHALEGSANPEDVQSFTWCFLMDHCAGEDHVIEKPKGYEARRDAQPIQWLQIHPITGADRPFILWDAPGWEGVSLWRYRRVLDAAQFAAGAFPGDVTLVNWPQNDFRGNFLDKSEDVRQEVLDAGKRLSLSLLYWMQTEAPRPDGGTGFPGLRLRPDLVGTEDGLAQYPYVRESRRILPVFRVLEQHISPDCQPGPLAESFVDSVGIGLYRIDIHMCAQSSRFIDIGCCPFQIPLGALIPQRMRNLIAACKNIGTTHISNGAYRLHPVEWNIGEAAGTLAAYVNATGVTIHQVREDSNHLKALQDALRSRGVPLEWPAMAPA